MKTSIEPLLAEHPFLTGLQPQYIELITGCASNVRFDAGQKIYKDGDEADVFYIIRHGRVAIEVFMPGRGEMTVETLGEGEVLGWSWMFPPFRWHFDARAVELTRAVALDGKCLRAKCDHDPALGYEMLKRIAQVMMERLDSARMQLLDVYGARK